MGFISPFWTSPPSKASSWGSNSKEEVWSLLLALWSVPITKKRKKSIFRVGHSKKLHCSFVTLNKVTHFFPGACPCAVCKALNTYCPDCNTRDHNGPPKDQELRPFACGRRRGSIQPFPVVRTSEHWSRTSRVVWVQATQHRSLGVGWGDQALPCQQIHTTQHIKAEEIYEEWDKHLR